MLGLALELPDPFPRDREFLAERCEGSGFPLVEAVAPDEDVSMAFGEPLDSLLEEGSFDLAYDLACRVGAALIFDEFFELRAVFFGTQVSVETGCHRHGVFDVPHLIYAPPQPPGGLFVGRIPPQLRRELVVGAYRLPYLLARVHGDPDGAALVGHGPPDGLPYPPGGVGREAEALLGIEPFDSLHQPNVALLDQILE